MHAPSVRGLHRFFASSGWRNGVFEPSGNGSYQRVVARGSVVTEIVDEKGRRAIHPAAHAAEEIAPHLIGEGAVRESVTKSWLRQPKYRTIARNKGKPSCS